MTIQLLHDPATGPLPSGLTTEGWQPHLTLASFAVQPADRRDTYCGPCCGRCNRPLTDHVWQIVNPDDAEQGGVLDCGLIAVLA